MIEPISFRTSTGIPVRFWPGSGGAPLLFVHGHGGNGGTLRAAYEPWLGRRPVSALELPWHGAAPRPSVADAGANARAVLDVLGALGWFRCRAVAHSAASLDVMRATLLEPVRFSGHLYVGPTGDCDEAHAGEFLAFASALRTTGLDEGFVDALVARWFSAEYRGRNPGLRARLADELSRADGAAVATALEAFVAAPPVLPRADQLRKLSLRLVALVMREDPAAPRDWSAPLLAAIGAQVIDLPGGHRPFEEQPEAFQAALSSFLDDKP